MRRAFPEARRRLHQYGELRCAHPGALERYVALLLIVEFSARDEAVDPLARLTRARGLAPKLPIFIFARGGNERNAARTIKLGASDYWPIHAVKSAS